MASRVPITRAAPLLLQGPSKSAVGHSFSKLIHRFLSSKPKSPSKHRRNEHLLVANVLRSYGFSPSQLRGLLNRNYMLVGPDFTDVEASLGLLTSFGLSRESTVSLITCCPSVLDLGFLKRWEVQFSKLQDLCISPEAIKSVICQSRRLEIDPVEFTNSFCVLNDMGFSTHTIRKIFTDFPKVIRMEEKEIHNKVKFLIGIGISSHEADLVFFSYPRILEIGIESRLRPLLKEFNDLGFSREVVSKEVAREPRILGMESGELHKCLQLLKTLKCREAIKLNILRYGAFRAGIEVKLRVDCLCKHGLIRREAFKVLWQEPRTIIYRVEDIEKKIKFLVDSMRFDVGCLVDVPQYLGVSFEKQIVPRHNVIAHLRAKGGVGGQLHLSDIIKPSRRRFYNLYVKPYPECEKMYGRVCVDEEGERRHVNGLWMLFKPKWSLDSKDEVDNITSFMESLV